MVSCFGFKHLQRSPKLPNIKAAAKWTRQTGKRTAHNRDVKSRLRTLYVKAASGELPAPEAEAAFDKAASKGAIHPNKAARKKSRLAKALAKQRKSKA
jgi:small subunit ribosomal protein S20